MPNQKRPEGIRASVLCAQACTQCAYDCLHLGGEHATPAHQTKLHDCAEICALLAHFLARHSPNSSALCVEGVVICERAAESCDKLDRGDARPFMKDCARACRECAAACSAVVGLGAGFDAGGSL